MIDCIHAASTDRPSVVECRLGLHGGRPHAGLCGRCARREPRPAAVLALRAEDRLNGPGRPTGNRARPAMQGRAKQVAAAARPRRTGGRRNGPVWSQVETHLVLRNFLSPGDVLMLTAAVRDLHRAYPGRFTTAVQTACPGLWQNNPYLTPVELLGRTPRSIECQYPLIHQSNQRPFHFIHGYTQDLESQLGLQIPVTDFRGDVYMSAEEKRLPSPVAEAGHSGPYWVMMAGGKYDFTAKWWSPDFYQAVVDHFHGKIKFVQCGEADHWHPPLHGVVNLIGKTSDVRRFIRLIYHADGVVCPVTFAMHLSAAVDLRPGQTARGCVVIAGGREPTHWEMYPGHQFLHTQGALSCCSSGGCWKSRCQPVDDGDEKNSDLCVAPVEIGPNLRIPKCMHIITPQRVIQAIELYYEGGALAQTADVPRPAGPPRAADMSGPSAPVPGPALTPAVALPPPSRGTARTYANATPSIGLVVATFAAVPYVHLHLAAWARHYRNVPLLVCDDGSPFGAQLKELCAEYGADFVANPSRLRRTVGDLSAYMHGFDWAASRGADILVKMSRRFIPCYDWAPELQQLADRSQMPTFSQFCGHFNFGFRTECIGFHCDTWRRSGASDQIAQRVKQNEPAFVEGFIHELARSLLEENASDAARIFMSANPMPADRDGYAPWSIMPDKRTARDPRLLWHDSDEPFDYCRLACLHGLRYTVRDFEDPNQGCGLGEP